MPQIPFPVHEDSGFTYVDEGPASSDLPVVLLHGMLGHLSNWIDTIRELPLAGYRVLVPVLPVYDMPLRETSVPGLTEYTSRFLDALKLDRFMLVGNSLGGHVAIMYALEHGERVAAMVLTGASGIYEVTIGKSTPRRYDPDWIRQKAALTFFDPKHATDELVAEMGQIVGNRKRTLRLIRMARSAKKEMMLDRLHEIAAPTLLIWGADDEITPPDVAEDFRSHLQQADLHFLPECGHAPMIEQPEAFNRVLIDWLDARSKLPASGANNNRTLKQL